MSASLETIGNTADYVSIENNHIEQMLAAGLPSREIPAPAHTHPTEATLTQRERRHVATLTCQRLVEFSPVVFTASAVVDVTQNDNDFFFNKWAQASASRSV